MSTLKRDYRALANIDPSLCILRHWTSAEARALAVQANMQWPQVRRVFRLYIWNTTAYLKKSLDPDFEPNECDRDWARKRLDVRQSQQNKTLSPKQTVHHHVKPLHKRERAPLYHYKF